MKKKLLAGIYISLIILTFGGCRISSKELLSFDEMDISAEYALDNQLTQAGFFSRDLVIITEEDNKGEDAQLTSGSSLLVNITDQQILYADNVYHRLYPASLTKLMTALVLLKYGELNDLVTISYNASHITEGGAKLCGFLEGDVITMEALLKSLLIYSGNDAAIAVADHVAGSEADFVVLMNEEINKIGAVHTNFMNSSGLHDDNQFTTAYDIYIIFNELMKYETFRSIIGTSSYTAVYKDKDDNPVEKTFLASNAYLSSEATPPEGIQIIGGKTGTTRKAGNCLVLLSKDDTEKEYISVILKSSDRQALYSQMSYLLSFTNENP